MRGLENIDPCSTCQVLFDATPSIVCAEQPRKSIKESYKHRCGEASVISSHITLQQYDPGDPLSPFPLPADDKQGRRAHEAAKALSFWTPRNQQWLAIAQVASAWSAAGKDKIVSPRCMAQPAPGTSPLPDKLFICT